MSDWYDDISCLYKILKNLKELYICSEFDCLENYEVWMMLEILIKV